MQLFACEGGSGASHARGLDLDAMSDPPPAPKRVPRKKAAATGVWPCKIHGCTKQFAREADLKRHQRTTKLHSMPSFACPQCDASFTRTDALRRHQKSRHNGVVVEPVEPCAEEPRSRSGTPSVKGKERAGPSSHYRWHTATTSRTPAPAQPAAFQPPLALPTSAVRTAPPWHDGPYQSPHYRPHTSGYHTGHSPPSASTSRNTSSQPPNAEDTLCIDPALDGDGPHLTAADVVAAVRAVLLQAESEEKAKRQREEEEQRMLLEQEGYDPLALRRPEPMEHILTEDGEPMLNPGASFLTLVAIH
ncbi:hypothetical protein HYPSUDRAFT_901770 [Hypholoma sublateritium FD-334 SS-4]|uniref:C2H2-type domain-containing protein n=1 Tax=Hypholoma sublateritium (strain FD-334 SS-4) TaxID=945553 RepID=A0A0D2M7Q1_HYPSF|nr:hypothetical protein HYPSUDRAFT_901770 [Hypholoma sublateritium FD-334 SS-4]